MRTLDFCRYAFSISVAVAVLAACGGSQPPIGAPATMPQTSAIATHAGRGGSWMLPEAKSEDLLYVTNYGNVTVYTYPQGKLVGNLTGFHSAVGECEDNKGDVFVTNGSPTRIFEYPHGGTERMATLKVEHVGPVGCAIDPITSDLAVSGFSGGYAGGVEVFKGARGKPSFYSDSSFFYTQFCGFDDKGNPFVDGPRNTDGDPAFAELPKGSRKFVDIKLDAIINSDGGIQRDGKHIAVGAYIPPRGTQSTPVIYQFAIHGNRGTRVGTTSLGSPAYIRPASIFMKLCSTSQMLAFPSARLTKPGGESGCESSGKAFSMSFFLARNMHNASVSI